jgi:hypothetical protein
MQSQMNHVLMQKDMSYLKETMNLEEKNLAFSGFINNNIVASAGMKLLWGGVAEGWVMATQDVWRHPGLKNEGLMEYYGIDGSHHYRYARIF